MPAMLGPGDCGDPQHGVRSMLIAGRRGCGETTVNLLHLPTFLRMDLKAKQILNGLGLDVRLLEPI